ncbi:PREDICTED: uncharacterized protein LOC104823959 isoform X2 [Tarenaya hassleriana]|uniref:uncharacterized protein LOC104823959 isoform X2 n=1 Tax=Tarenaya hassleriana TaxID=28532 RepID=UPI00053C899E|nr:PREDICTED: uncharacterized protein LOC104823959 isoform X2 [Tarenaya hassleriana]
MATIHHVQFTFEIPGLLHLASSSVRFLRPSAAASPSLPRHLLRRASTTLFRARSFSTAGSGESFSVKIPEKPPICTADELHYVSVADSDWRLALWRYLPPPQVPVRNHPLLLLSGVGTNAIGYDLSPGSSFARYMSAQGFDTWVLEVRGAGLSTRVSDLKDAQQSAHEASDQMESTARVAAEQTLSRQKQVTDVVNGTSVGEVSAWDESTLVSKLTATFMRLSERLSGFLSEGQRSVSPQLIDLQERLSSTIEDFQKQLDLIIKYDWDFDHYLEEDVPAAIEYIKAQSKPKDGKLLAIGHSMGGILLYAMLSRCAFEGREPCLAAVVTLASSVDYTTSNSRLKLLLPLADPAQALNVPVVPLGALLAAAYPLSSRPPYALSWLNDMISAADMMHPELLQKLVLNNFCTIPAKLILQLTTAFREGGLRDRSGKFYYKDCLSRINVPVLALAGDRDLICPPQAVEETVKLLPRDRATYKVFGEPDGPHYAHYDLVGGRLAVEQVYPCIIEFLCRYDCLRM